MNPLSYSELIEYIKTIDPKKYEKTRNFIDGDVTKLSPYISHGVVSVGKIAKIVLQTWSKKEAYKFIQELAWREFFQKIWRGVGDDIWKGVISEQGYRNTGIPIGILNGTTGISAIDHAVKELYTTGYIHNHARMWIASYCCNIARCRWQDGAKWMYYHLLDGDRASNTLSWQWIAGTLTGKSYITNQETINKFTQMYEKNTLLDHSYEYLADHDQSKDIARCDWEPKKIFLPESSWRINMPTKDTILLYTPWTLDPEWHSTMDATRILIIDTKEIQRFPLSQSRINWIVDLAHHMIPNVHIFVGDINMLSFDKKNILQKSHPVNKTLISKKEDYCDMFSHPWTSGGFMKWWKKAEKEYFTRDFLGHIHI